MRARGLLFTALLVIGAGSDVMPQQAQLTEIEGTLEVLIEDSDLGEELEYVIDTGGSRWKVNVGKGQRELEGLTTGTRVRARGRSNNSNLLELGNDGGVTTLALASPNTFGNQRVAVILVNFTDNFGTPHTAGDASAVTFGSVNNFYLENSYGQTSLSGDVFGWYTIPMSSTACDQYQIAALADQEATSRGVDLSQYTRKIYSFPTNACTWWGSGTVGGNPSLAWVRGTYSLKVVAHELGHNFGDYHSKSMPCEAGGCSTIEYGDDRDIMGQYGVGHLNAFQKERLGWLNYGASPLVRTVTGPGTYWVDSLQMPGGTKALKILKSSQAGNTSYYVEARTQTGADAGYAPGVVIHTGNDVDGNSSVQIDLDPVTSGFDPVLDPGQSFGDASISLTITTASMDAGGAWVTVAMPEGAPCSYVISPTSSSNLSYAGAAGSFSISTGPSCTWTASTSQGWIQTSSNGTGSGTVSYSVGANAAGARSGTIVVGGQTYTVNQAAAPCAYSLNPTTGPTLPGTGGSGSTQMTASAGCSWTATTTKNWIHTSSAGTGNGTITFTVDANSGNARSGAIKAGGQTYTVSQAAASASCSYTLNPTSSGTLAVAGASASFAVSTGGGCSWTATTTYSWIRTSSTGAGNGTVNYSVDPNTGAARTGTIVVGGRTFNVSQAGACKQGQPGCRK